MEYHIPDARWGIFGMGDFESYSEKLVVKGFFHPAVPKDVVEAFEVAEYMMAHAYYHYKLYDEAFTKLLLIIEMAIKLRCANFNIPIVVIRKNGTNKDIPLEQLIIQVCKAEPLKNIEVELQWLRKGRNNKMHPKNHTFSGSIANFEKIKHGIVLLNKLFITEQSIHASVLKTLEKNKQLIQFKQGLYVLEIGDLRYLIESLNIEDALFVNNEWLYFMVAAPISNNIAEQVRGHNYAPPHTFIVKDITFEGNSLKIADVTTEKQISIITTDDPANVEIYKNFVIEKNEALAEFEGVTIIQTSSPFGQQYNDFLYKWLWKVSE